MPAIPRPPPQFQPPILPSNQHLPLNRHSPTWQHLPSHLLHSGLCIGPQLLHQLGDPVLILQGRQSRQAAGKSGGQSSRFAGRQAGRQASRQAGRQESPREAGCTGAAARHLNHRHSPLATQASKCTEWQPGQMPVAALGSPWIQVPPCCGHRHRCQGRRGRGWGALQGRQGRQPGAPPQQTPSRAPPQRDEPPGCLQEGGVRQKAAVRAGGCCAPPAWHSRPTGSASAAPGRT
jgi:hypothetical protein